jgi:hypothetical protein
LRQRREFHVSRLAADVSVLEERSLLSSSVLGPETLMNQTVGGNQSFGSGRSFAVNASQGVIAAWSSTAGGGSNIIAR